MTRRTTAASLAAALVTLLLVAGEASATSPTPASGSTWYQNQQVTYRWKEGYVPPSWMRAAVNGAASDSNRSRASKAAVLSQSDGGTSWISYTGDIPSGYAIGYTITYIPGYFTMRLRPQGYALDWGNLHWCQFYDSPPTGCYDAEMITLHEMGHVQTLDHPDDANVTDWTDTIMHWAPKTKAKAGWNMHEFGRCDVARLQIRYQALTSYTAYSTCLDLSTSASLSTSAVSAPAGGSVTFNAALKVADGVSWPMLASQPLAGRQLTLQRRPIGGTTWSNVSSMASIDDAGRYTRTLTVSYSYDYRVLFSAPSQEGLQGATSPVVRVTVKSVTGECVAAPADADGQMYTC